MGSLSRLPDNYLILEDYFVLIGGAKEDRTPDLLNAIQALSQLSYGPTLRYR